MNPSVFWTDSQTVLKYIGNDYTRFKTYVANRVALIRDNTDLSQWRYVKSKDNPADDASPLATKKMDTCHRVPVEGGRKLSCGKIIGLSSSVTR